MINSYNGKNIQIKTSSGIETFDLNPMMMSNANIEWTFTEVTISDSDLDYGRQNYFSDIFVGSSHLLGDEGFIFDPSTLTLISMTLMVPENNFSGSNIIQFWLNTPVKEGLPVIRYPHKFSVESPLDHRYFSVKDEMLICISGDHVQLDFKICNRLRIHSNLEILCHNGTYIGYILKNATQYLTRFSEEKRLSKMVISHPIVADCLSEYFYIVNEDNFERLEEQDKDLKQRLINLKDELTELDQSFEPVFALTDRCNVILEEYYL